MSFPFLPPLNNEKFRLSPGTPGTWQPQQGIAYSEVADSLARPQVGTDTKSISSIPDMWARPLLVDMVLRDPEHPLHDAIKSQWKGMLAAIALAEVKGLKPQAQLLDLKALGNDSFIKALDDLKPSEQKTVYQLTEKVKGKNRHPWEKIYVFVLDGRPGGITSPASLVCPSEHGNWEGIPWYSEGRLQSPLDSSKYLTDDDRVQLWLWLDNLRKQLDKETDKGDVDSKRIKEILEEYQKELEKESSITPSSQNLRLSNNQKYFGTLLTLGELDALNVPIQAKEHDSLVEIQPLGKTATEKVYFIPREIEQLSQQWTSIQPKDIWIYKKVSAEIFKLEEFEKQYKKKITYLTEDDIFADTLYYLEGKGNLPGALLPESVDEITYTVDEQEHTLTPLLPIKAEIIQYFSSEELIKRLVFHPTTIGNKSGITVTLTLPLSGGDFSIEREYPIEQSNAITDQPFLEIWPNFKAPNWKAYYAFYFDDRIEATQHNTTFRAVFPETITLEQHPIELKQFQWTRLESFPDYIICQDDNDPTLIKGLILLKTPPDVGTESPNKTWTVGVDFGTSFTNVYYEINNLRNPLSITPLHLQVTKESSDPLLYRYFMPPNNQTFPLSSVLTIEGSKEEERVILDGRVRILEDVKKFDPKKYDIKTNLKWKPENISYNRTFLKHLALLIAAEAANNHVKKINWSISYPSAFSPSDKNLYLVTWQRIIEDLQQTTGIDHQWVSRGKPYRAESLALAHYFADEEGKDLVYTTCIDLGGGTSDVSIWVGNKLIHQCSLQIAGRLLFAQFWKNRQNILETVFEQVNFQDLISEQRDEPFFVKLDSLLSAEGDEWLNKYRTAMNDNRDLQSIVQLSALGLSALYYYIGLVLRALDIEEKYTRKQNTPVYIGGNGSRILNWLDVTGKFMPDGDAFRLFSRMLSHGSGFEDTNEVTVLSSKPKAEVACGLVLDQLETRLTGLQDEEEDVFAGEDCVINGVSFDWNQRLDLRQFKQIESFNISGLEEEDGGLANLKQFFDDFQKSLQDLRISNIKRLKQYEDEQWRDSLWKGVKRKVEADLMKLEGRDSEDVRVEPPYILGLKALLKELNEKLEGGNNES